MSYFSKRNDPGFDAARRCGGRNCAHCMNQPWLTTIDWPVNAFDPKEAKNNAVCATSSTVVNSPSTVSLSITFLMTSCSETPSSFACSGICLSTSGVRTNPAPGPLAKRVQGLPIAVSAEAADDGLPAVGREQPIVEAPRIGRRLRRKQPVGRVEEDRLSALFDAAHIDREIW